MSKEEEEEPLVPLDDELSRGERGTFHSHSPLPRERNVVRVAVMNRTVLSITRQSRETMEYKTQLISVTPPDLLACQNFILGNEKRLAFHQSTWNIEISDDGVRIYRQTLTNKAVGRNSGRLRFLPPDEEHGIFLETEDDRYESFIKSLKSALDTCAREVNARAKTDMPVELRSPSSWIDWVINCK